MDAVQRERSEQARLVAGVAEGDRGALAALYDAYAGPLYGFALRRLGDAALAEELVQQVLLQVWRHAGRYDPQRGSVRTWIMAIARNATVDLHRRRPADRPTWPLPDRAVPDENDELEHLLQAEMVRAALERLSHEHRRVLELVYFRGCSQAEAAEQLGLPLGTVKSRTYYALKAFRLALEELGEAP
ncbi:sigma-70 family RNA polymerase sigma factor [Egibacter rhizosphaerae]|uniref:sigma-70 family RNA polymerase sigma factor n=1 Tax=Egibacter rhizosphaerae TaxID=1670831 RepID=UPI00197AD6CF|nr:sigma-70 family RNA polymerase sigma factor [Egibacter rhizosphaerae]